jgi:hypothetical protein
MISKIFIHVILIIFNKMWVLYSFKLAYANDNTFTMRVNTEWTLMEFDNKVNSFARMVFPGINIDDRFHMTESQNHRNYSRNRPAEENDPLVTEYNFNTLICETCEHFLEGLSFYIYFNNACNSLRETRNNGGPRTLEMVDVDYDYYYNIAMEDLQEARRQSRRNATNSDFYNNQVIQRQVSELSMPVSLDDMALEYNQQPMFDVRDLINDQRYTNNTYADDQYNIATSVAEFALNDYGDRRETDEDYYPINLNNEWGGINIIPELEIIPPLQTYDCCICFNQSECLTLNGCNHQVCTACYRGVFNRIGGAVDTRCPMCRINGAFSREIYESLDLYD